MFATSTDGTRIYFEVEGRGPPLLLSHGSFGSLADWRDFGYATALRDHHTLVLVDSRGHGRSDKPHEASSYSLALRVADLVTVLDALGIPKVDFFGYSMGGWIGFGLALYAPERCRSLILGGAHPFAEEMHSFRAMVPDKPSEFLAKLEPVYGVHLGTSMRDRMLENDLPALRALTIDREDFSGVLDAMTMPCLLFAGTSDARWPKVAECSRRIPNVTFISLADCGHVAAWARSDLTLPHVQQFLSKL